MTGVAIWSSWHLHLSSTARSLHDRVLREVVGPTVGTVPGRPWFFVRYWQAGPHLRLRIGDLDPDEHSRVDRSLRDRFTVAGEPLVGEQAVTSESYRSQAARFAATGEMAGPMEVAEMLPAGVHHHGYEPEVERYGGPSVRVDSERLFHLSSELVLAFLRSTPSSGLRAALAAQASQRAGAALGGPAEQRAYYRRGAEVSGRLARGYGYSDGQVEWLDRAVRDAVRSGRQPTPPGDVSSGERSGGLDDGPLGRWYTAVVDLVRTLRRRSPAEPEQVVASHVHMFHNRLGLTMFDELQTYLRLRYQDEMWQPETENRR